MMPLDMLFYLKFMKLTILLLSLLALTHQFNAIPHSPFRTKEKVVIQ